MCLTGDTSTLTVTEPGVYDIGRAEGAALRLAHPAVSRIQAYLSLSADRRSLRVQHVGAAGSLLNGQVLEGSAEIRDGDRLELAGVALEVRVEYGSEEDEPEAG